MNPLKDFMYKVADYITMEYGDTVADIELSDDEKCTVKNIIDAHFNLRDSVNNTAVGIVSYIRDSRSWAKENNQ